MSTEGEWPRTVQCRDAMGRDREVVVSVVKDPKLDEEALVVLAPPPGEAIVLTSRGVTELRALMRDAQIEALHQSRIG